MSGRAYAARDVCHCVGWGLTQQDLHGNETWGGAQEGWGGAWGGGAIGWVREKDRWWWDVCLGGALQDS